MLAFKIKKCILSLNPFAGYPCQNETRQLRAPSSALRTRQPRFAFPFTRDKGSVTMTVVKSQPRPTLHIVTGPPGSGKTTFASDLSLPVYDNDLGNKWEFMKAIPRVDAVLTVTAPLRCTKQLLVDRALDAGYLPKLYGIWIERMEAYKRMKQRSGLSPTERNNGEKWVEFWYKRYQRHPLEERITNP